MKYKYEFEMPDTPFENNCRVCPLCILDDGYTWCAGQEDGGFDAVAYSSETRLFEKYSELEINCPLEVVK